MLSDLHNSADKLVVATHCDLMQGTDHTVEIIAAILLPVAIVMCVYALTVFIWRAKAISKKQVGLGLAVYICSC